MAGYRANKFHHGKIIATMQPQTRTITWETGLRERMVFPHSIFVAYYTRHPDAGFRYYLNRLHVGFSKEPFTCDPSDKLYGLPMANTDVGHAICFYEWPRSNDPLEFIKKVVAQYWSSPFQEYNDSFSYWQMAYSQADPWFRPNWIESTKKGEYDWLLNEDLIQAPYIVDLAHLFRANSTESDETDIFLNLGSSNLQQKRWKSPPYHSPGGYWI